jgi:hypothetical protein
MTFTDAEIIIEQRSWGYLKIIQRLKTFGQRPNPRLELREPSDNCNKSRLLATSG